MQIKYKNFDITEGQKFYLEHKLYCYNVGFFEVEYKDFHYIISTNWFEKKLKYASKDFTVAIDFMHIMLKNLTKDRKLKKRKAKKGIVFGDKNYMNKYLIDEQNYQENIEN